jgi:RNA recognition motif-containing protein
MDYNEEVEPSGAEEVIIPSINETAGNFLNLNNAEERFQGIELETAGVDTNVTDLNQLQHIQQTGNIILNLGKLFVGQIPRDITEDELATYFESFGPIRELSIIRDPATAASKGKFVFKSFIVYLNSV